VPRSAGHGVDPVEVGSHDAADDATGAQAIALAGLHGHDVLEGHVEDAGADFGGRLDARRADANGDHVVLEGDEVAALHACCSKSTLILWTSRRKR
jgi:hypothetical protein